MVFGECPRIDPSFVMVEILGSRVPHSRRWIVRNARWVLSASFLCDQPFVSLIFFAFMTLYYTDILKYVKAWFLSHQAGRVANSMCNYRIVRHLRPIEHMLNNCGFERWKPPRRVEMNRIFPSGRYRGEKSS